jgi:glycerophosphoryl diester phosphodiesterase
MASTHARSLLGIGCRGTSDGLPVARIPTRADGATVVSVPARVFTDQPAVVGHRGMGKGTVDGYLENTLASFLAAVDAGCDWLEVDVGRSSDDELFVLHDAALSDGSFLADVPAEQAVAGGALRLPELLEALPPGAGVAFDVKSSLQDARRGSSTTTASLLARTCGRQLTDRPVLALSFDPAALQHMRAQAPGIALGLLTWIRFPIGHAVAAAAHLDVQVLSVHAGSLWRNASNGRHDIPPPDHVVARVHEARRQMMVWCPSPRRARTLAAAGVDALVVDDVPRQVRELDRLRSSVMEG